MITLRKCFTTITILSVLITACSNITTPQQLPSEKVSIALNTDPITPVVGNNKLILDIQDQDGQPIAGAIVNVSADHTEMSGMVMQGLATEQENGKYAITADFSMSGTWKVTVSVQKEKFSIQKDFEMIIQ
jgi:predicted component of type VI protein secretion system